MNIIKIIGETRDVKHDEILWYNSTYFVCDNQQVWNNILDKFDYYNKKADALGYYANNDWNVFIQIYKISESGEIIYNNTILKMTKELYHKYYNIKHFPYIPIFNENLTAYDEEDQNDCYQIGIYNSKTNDYDLYYAIDGFAPQFENEWDAWGYIYNNIPIR